MRRATLLLVALALSACAPSNDQGAAATAVAQVKGGLESQRQAVEALATQAPAAVEKAATQVGITPDKVATAAAAPEKVATAVAGTAQAVAPSVKPPLPVGAAAMNQDQIRQIAQDALARAMNVQPGQVYAQVITPGFRVVATVSGQRKEVHTDNAGRAIVCDRPSQ